MGFVAYRLDQGVGWQPLWRIHSVSPSGCSTFAGAAAVQRQHSACSPSPVVSPSQSRALAGHRCAPALTAFANIHPHSP
jgi:hypothetical protein